MLPWLVALPVAALPVALLVGMLLGVLVPAAVHAADPERGEQLYRTPRAPGLLVCADCHAEIPQINNFGNIWSGRHAPALIERAVQSNTGGMGVFQPLLTAADFADIAAFLGSQPKRLEFGVTPVGALAASQRVTISSSTKTDLSGLAIGVEGDFVVTASSCSATVARLTDCSVDVAFRPAADGLRQGVLLLNHLGTPSPVRIALRGQGRSRPPAVAAAHPAQLDLGRTPAGVPGATHGVRLSNRSDDALTLGTISTSDDAFAMVGGSCHPGLVLAGGQSCFVALRLQSGAAGARQGQLVIAHDGVGVRSTVALAGSVDAVPAASLQANMGTIDLGAAPVGGRIRSDTLIITNRGNATATLRTLASGSDALTVDPRRCGVGSSLVPGQSCLLTLSWAPTRAGRFSGELVFAADPASEPLRLPWTAIAGIGDLRAAPSKLAFEATTGSTVQRHARVVNRGSEGLRLLSISLGGPEAADFSLAPGSTCSTGTLLPPATGCTVALQFTPGAAGPRSARLTVVGDGGSSLAVELQGRMVTAARPSWWVDRTAIEVGGSAGERQPLDIHNRGGAAGTPALRLTGDAASDFTLGGDCDRALAPREHCTVEIGYAARVPGARVASLRVASADGHEAATIALQGLVPTLPPGAGTARSGPRNAIGDAPVPFTVSVFPSGVSATSGWALNGPAADDFSLDPSSPCMAAPPPSGARCELRLWFHPRAPGHRRAALQATGTDPAPVASIEGWAFGPPSPLLQAEPGALVFDARVGSTSPPQTLRVSNDGLAPMVLRAAQLRGGGFALGSSGARACRPADSGQLLLPGEDCSFEIRWSGTAASASGARLQLDAEDPFDSLQRLLVISEDPAQRSNVGTGGGHLGPWTSLPLLLAAALLHRRRKEPH